MELDTKRAFHETTSNNSLLMTGTVSFDEKIEKFKLANTLYKITFPNFI